jgi:hypothetical protein
MLSYMNITNIIREMIGRGHSSVPCPTYNNKIIYYINKK